MSTLDTLTLDGWQLDYFTGLALGYDMQVSLSEVAYRTASSFSPTRGDSDLMPVLMRMQTIMQMSRLEPWQARAKGCSAFAGGESLPVAVCRALVLGRWGSTVELAATPGGDCVGSYVNDSNSCEDLF